MKLDFIKEKHDIENTIKKYTNTISKIAYSYTKSKETAEDITQNVFLKYMISEHTFHDDEHKKHGSYGLPLTNAKTFSLAELSAKKLSKNTRT